MREGEVLRNLVDTFGAAIGGDRDSSVKLLTRVSFRSSLAVPIAVKETSKPGFTMSQTFNTFSFVLQQLDWRHCQSLALMPNPNLDKERSQCGPRLLRYANSQREYPARSAKEQILFPPLEEKVKTLVPLHLRQGNPGKEKHLRTRNIKI